MLGNKNNNMSEGWAIALAVFCLSQALAFAGAGITAYFILITKMAEARVEAEHRFTELETKCEKWFVLSASNALHKDDDRFGMDRDLEHFVILYKSHNHDMPADKWVYYQKVFREIMANKLATPNEKMLAEGLAELCEHKMMRDQTAYLLLANKPPTKGNV